MSIQETATPAADAFSGACPSRQTVQHLTGRWGALTMAALGSGTLRFGELRRRVGGISDRMLAQTLSQLERDGMVQRRVHSAIPPRVDYTLTPLGRDVAEPLCRLISLVESRMPEVAAAQAAYDAASQG